MLTQLEDQLIAAHSEANGQGMIDVTLPLQVMFSNTDRTICKAKLRYHNPDRDASLILIVGLRSDILSPFQRFEVDRKGRYLPCDILGIVPGLALMVTSINTGLALSAIAKDNTTRLVLVFEGISGRKGGSLKSLSASVSYFMQRWTEWTDVLLGIIRRDPIVVSWDIDWREFLAGESGFVTMPWFRPMTFSERELALRRVLVASKALLASVLSETQLRDPMILGLKDWLDDLQPLPEVIGGIQVSEEVEI
ncbi:MAG: hypothetical protein AM325_004790 [Candidatus Thorarchaeota archaeon SMTZ1-45]|nr:MAG: hypothetical protein AM325_06555 [Candidatus Thorarchaeota archaeon SMTZ1-45]